MGFWCCCRSSKGVDQPQRQPAAKSTQYSLSSESGTLGSAVRVCIVDGKRSVAVPASYEALKCTPQCGQSLTKLLSETSDLKLLPILSYAARDEACHKAILEEAFKVQDVFVQALIAVLVLRSVDDLNELFVANSYLRAWSTVGKKSESRSELLNFLNEDRNRRPQLLRFQASSSATLQSDEGIYEADDDGEEAGPLRPTDTHHEVLSTPRNADELPLTQGVQAVGELTKSCSKSGVDIPRLSLPTTGGTASALQTPTMTKPLPTAHTRSGIGTFRTPLNSLSRSSRRLCTGSGRSSAAVTTRRIDLSLLKSPPPTGHRMDKIQEVNLVAMTSFVEPAGEGSIDARITANASQTIAATSFWRPNAQRSSDSAVERLKQFARDSGEWSCNKDMAYLMSFRYPQLKADAEARSCADLHSFLSSFEGSSIANFAGVDKELNQCQAPGNPSKLPLSTLLAEVAFAALWERNLQANEDDDTLKWTLHKDAHHRQRVFHFLWSTMWTFESVSIDAFAAVVVAELVKCHQHRCEESVPQKARLILRKQKQLAFILFEYLQYLRRNWVSDVPSCSVLSDSAIGLLTQLAFSQLPVCLNVPAHQEELCFRLILINVLEVVFKIRGKQFDPLERAAYERIRSLSVEIRMAFSWSMRLARGTAQSVSKRAGPLEHPMVLFVCLIKCIRWMYICALRYYETHEVRSFSARRGSTDSTGGEVRRSSLDFDLKRGPNSGFAVNGHDDDDVISGLDWFANAADGALHATYAACKNAIVRTVLLKLWWAILSTRNVQYLSVQADTMNALAKYARWHFVEWRDAYYKKLVSIAVLHARCLNELLRLSYGTVSSELYNLNAMHWCLQEISLEAVYSPLQRSNPDIDHVQLSPKSPKVDVSKIQVTSSPGSPSSGQDTFLSAEDRSDSSSSTRYDECSEHSSSSSLSVISPRASARSMGSYTDGGSVVLDSARKRSISYRTTPRTSVTRDSSSEYTTATSSSHSRSDSFSSCSSGSESDYSSAYSSEPESHEDAVPKRVTLPGLRLPSSVTKDQQEVVGASIVVKKSSAPTPSSQPKAPNGSHAVMSDKAASKKPFVLPGLKIPAEAAKDGSAVVGKDKTMEQGKKKPFVLPGLKIPAEAAKDGSAVVGKDKTMDMGKKPMILPGLKIPAEAAKDGSAVVRKDKAMEAGKKPVVLPGLKIPAEAAKDGTAVVGKDKSMAAAKKPFVLPGLRIPAEASKDGSAVVGKDKTVDKGPPDSARYISARSRSSESASYDSSSESPRSSSDGSADEYKSPLSSSDGSSRSRSGSQSSHLSVSDSDGSGEGELNITRLSTVSSVTADGNQSRDDGALKISAVGELLSDDDDSDDDGGAAQLRRPPTPPPPAIAALPGVVADERACSTGGLPVREVTETPQIASLESPHGRKRAVGLKSRVTLTDLERRAVSRDGKMQFSLALSRNASLNTNNLLNAEHKGSLGSLSASESADALPSGNVNNYSEALAEVLSMHRKKHPLYESETLHEQLLLMVLSMSIDVELHSLDTRYSTDFPGARHFYYPLAVILTTHLNDVSSDQTVGNVYSTLGRKLHVNAPLLRVNRRVPCTISHEFSGSKSRVVDSNALLLEPMSAAHRLESQRTTYSHDASIMSSLQIQAAMLTASTLNDMIPQHERSFAIGASPRPSGRHHEDDASISTWSAYVQYAEDIRRLLRLLRKGLIAGITVLDGRSAVSGHVTVGKGAYGDVYKLPVVGSTKITPKMCMKCVPYERAHIHLLHDVYNEVAILDRTRADGRVCHMYSYSLDHDLRYQIVLHLYDGTLRDYRHTHPKLSILRMTKILAETLKASLCLPEYQLIHFDLKCDNVFLLRNSGENGTAPDPILGWSEFDIVLGDFGEAKQYSLDRKGSEYTARNRGTEFMKSPEMLQIAMGDKKNADFYDRRKVYGAGSLSDVWSIGCMVYEFLSPNCDLLFYDTDWIRFWARVVDKDSTSELIPAEKLELCPPLRRVSRLREWLNYVLARDVRARPFLVDAYLRFHQKVLAVLMERKRAVPEIGPVASSIPSESAVAPPAASQRPQSARVPYTPRVYGNVLPSSPVKSKPQKEDHVSFAAPRSSLPRSRNPLSKSQSLLEVTMKRSDVSDSACETVLKTVEDVSRTCGYEDIAHEDSGLYMLCSGVYICVSKRSLSPEAIRTFGFSHAIILKTPPTASVSAQETPRNSTMRSVDISFHGGGDSEVMVEDRKETLIHSTRREHPMDRMTSMFRSSGVTCDCIDMSEKRLRQPNGMRGVVLEVCLSAVKRMKRTLSTLSTVPEFSVSHTHEPLRQPPRIVVIGANVWTDVLALSFMCYTYGVSLYEAGLHIQRQFLHSGLTQCPPQFWEAMASVLTSDDSLNSKSLFSPPDEKVAEPVLNDRDNVCGFQCVCGECRWMQTDVSALPSWMQTYIRRGDTVMSRWLEDELFNGIFRSNAGNTSRLGSGQVSRLRHLYFVPLSEAKFSWSVMSDADTRTGNAHRLPAAYARTGTLKDFADVRAIAGDSPLAAKGFMFTADATQHMGTISSIQVPCTPPLDPDPVMKTFSATAYMCSKCEMLTHISLVEETSRAEKPLCISGFFNHIPTRHRDRLSYDRRPFFFYKEVQENTHV